MLVDAIAGAVGLDEIYEHALDGLEAALGVKRSGVLLLDQHQVARFVAWRGLSEEYRRRAEGHFPWRVDATDPPPIAVTDAVLDPSLADLHESLRRENIGSVAFIPLVYDRRLLGKFMLYHSKPHEFSPEDLAVARTIGRLIAFAVERTKIESALRDVDRSKDEFLATLAHELRNPLAALSAALDVLAMRHGATVERETSISKRQVQHLVRLIDDLLDVSRITRGLVDLKKEPVELSTVVTRAVETTRPLFERLHHDLVVSVPERQLMADPIRLEQILVNLLSNAAKYTPAGGTITVVASSQRDQVVLHIRDNGIGMSPELIPRVFDLFTQGARSLDRTQGGLGIGLTITKQLVQLHGGTITAHSEGLGKGSEFVVTLPAPLGSEVADHHATGRRENAVPLGPSCAHVLLVDDNVDMATSLAELIRSWGNAVEIESTSRGALAAVERVVPDIILLDIGLPEIDGYELAQRFRAMPYLADTSLVALSGYAQPADIHRSFEVGFVTHLVKPVDANTLRRLLVRLEKTREERTHPAADG